MERWGTRRGVESREAEPVRSLGRDEDRVVFLKAINLHMFLAGEFLSLFVSLNLMKLHMFLLGEFVSLFVSL